MTRLSFGGTLYKLFWRAFERIRKLFAPIPYGQAAKCAWCDTRVEPFAGDRSEYGLVYCNAECSAKAWADRW